MSTLVAICIAAAFIIWGFLIFSLRKQIRYATLFRDMLRFYPYMSILAFLIFGLGVSLLNLSPILNLLLAVPLIFSIYLIDYSHKWINTYRMKRYRSFLKSLKQEKYSVRLFDELIKGTINQEKVNVFIRHDVDISLPRAIKMAEIEQIMGIQSTYFFRMHAEKYTFEQAKPIIKKLHEDGFGVGLHYEVLSYTRGNREEAIALFEEDLLKLREIAPSLTVCAHGAKNYSNRDIWSEIDQDALHVQSAYDLNKDKYISDAGGKKLSDSEGRHRLEEIYSAKPGQVVQVLIHPDWWY